MVFFPRARDMVKNLRSVINKNRDVVINILSIICYCILFFNWNLLEKINPPTKIRTIIISDALHIDIIGALVPFIFSLIFIMPHFSKVFKKANTLQKKKRIKRRPFDAETLKPIKHAKPEEIFGAALNAPTTKTSTKKKS